MVDGGRVDFDAQRLALGAGIAQIAMRPVDLPLSRAKEAGFRLTGQYLTMRNEILKLLHTGLMPFIAEHGGAAVAWDQLLVLPD